MSFDLVSFSQQHINSNAIGIPYQAVHRLVRSLSVLSFLQFSFEEKIEKIDSEATGKMAGKKANEK